MTAQILKSHMTPQLELEIANFAQAMRDWRAHMARVEEDRRNGVEGIDKHEPYQRPIASELVDSAIDEEGNPDYEIVDDDPTPEQVLMTKKAALFGEVARSEAAAAEKIIPSAKRRLFNLQESAIYAADEKLAADLKKKKKGRIAKVWDAALGKDVDTVAVEAADLRAQRPAKDNAHLDAQAERRERLNALALLSAQAIADIQDLTADSIDDWKLPNFDV
jgi:hypothetical protein